MIPNVLEDHFTCPICFEIMEDPSTTSCGHNFCMKCINNININKLECAICRTNLYNEKLTINFQMKNAIAALKTLSTQNKSSNINNNINDNNISSNNNNFIPETKTNFSFKIPNPSKQFNIYNSTNEYNCFFSSSRIKRRHCEIDNIQLDTSYNHYRVETPINNANKVIDNYLTNILSDCENRTNNINNSNNSNNIDNTNISIITMNNNNQLNTENNNSNNLIDQICYLNNINGYCMTSMNQVQASPYNRMKRFKFN
jgi:hypothetical protein